MTAPETPSAARLDLLRFLPGLHAIPETTLATLAASLRTVYVEPGTVIARLLEQLRSAYLIAEGCAAVTVRGEPVAALGPGSYVDGGTLRDYGRAVALAAKTRLAIIEMDPVALARAADGTGTEGSTV